MRAIAARREVFIVMQGTAYDTAANRVAINRVLALTARGVSPARREVFIFIFVQLPVQCAKRWGNSGTDRIEPG